MLQNIYKGDIKIKKEQKKQAEYRYIKASFLERYEKKCRII